MKWEVRSWKWELSSWKQETRYEKWEFRNLKVGGGMALNWVPRNGKWDSNEDSCD